MNIYVLFFFAFLVSCTSNVGENGTSATNSNGGPTGECPSNFCQDNGLTHGYHCNDGTSSVCGTDDNGCAILTFSEPCTVGCQAVPGTELKYCPAPEPNEGDPFVSGVDGPISDGATITIRGTDLGNNAGVDRVTFLGGRNGPIESVSPGFQVHEWDNFVPNNGFQNGMYKSRVQNRNGLAVDQSPPLAWSYDQVIDSTITRHVDQGGMPQETGWARAVNYQSPNGPEVGFDRALVTYWTYWEWMAPRAPDLNFNNKIFFFGPTLPDGSRYHSGWCYDNMFFAGQMNSGSLNWRFDTALSAGCGLDPGYKCYDYADDIVNDSIWDCNSHYPRVRWCDSLSDGQKQTMMPAVHGEWTRVQLYLQKSSNPGVPDGYFEWFSQPEGMVRQHVSAQTNVITHAGTCTTEKLIQAYPADHTFPTSGFTLYNMSFVQQSGEHFTHVRIFVDDMFIQEGSRARVELGNNSDYEKATYLEIQPPLSWKSDSVSVKLNYGGAFQGDETVYLFVVREDGKVSGGHPITLP